MKRERKRGLISQFYILIFAGIIITGVFIYLTQYLLAIESVKSQIRTRAQEAVREVFSSMQEYPAYRWLFSYWAEHADELEIEYDAEFSGNTLTKEKCEKFSANHPDLMFRYCDEAQVKALDPEDQKLYAEIAYSWLNTRINSIKQNFGLNYLFIVLTDTDEGENPYAEQFFLMSGADPDSVRGTEYEQVYTLGVTVKVDQEETLKAMKEAVKSVSASSDGRGQIAGEKMENSGRYVDFYSVLDLMDGKAALTGVTYYQGDLIDQIRISALLHTLLAIAYQVVLLTLVLRRVFVYMLRPLKNVLEEIRAYAVSKDSRKAEKNLAEHLSGRHAYAIRQNEIGQLAEDFIDLTKEIDEYTRQIEVQTAVRERFEYELETAAQIQTHMLPEAHPRFPDHPEFLLSASMIPARNVGGDFYDYYLPDDRHLVMVIADVSDKGIPAALFMAQAKTMIKSRALVGEDPAQILSHVNEQLNENNDDEFFVTVWIGMIDLVTGEGIAANAGHEHPTICRAGGNFELVIYKHDMGLGMINGITYRQHEFRLFPGDRLFVYTDGVPEACNANEEQFGTDRMLKTLNACRDAEPDRLLEQMGDAIDTFTGEAPRFDDTTMMCLWYKGAPEAGSSSDDTL